MSETLRTDPARLAGFIRGNPILGRVGYLAGPEGIYLVGGAVRDLLLGHDPLDLDLVVEFDPEKLGLDLDPEALVHERFQTAEAMVDGTRVDIARARSERYPVPGALPQVAPADINRDLGRRDFTINAIAIPLADPGVLLDPHRGRQDLEQGVLRVLHDKSFRDDPTRALRAARYSARFHYDLAPATADLLAGADLGTVSADRVKAELELIANESNALEALRLASRWQLIEIPEDRLELARAALALGLEPAWAGTAKPPDTILAAIRFDRDGVCRKLGEEPPSPSAGVALADGFSGTDLLLARAAGVSWLDRYRSDWSAVELEITGTDLLAAGVPEGHAVGVGMSAALAAKLDRGVAGAEEELEIACAAARAGGVRG
ncbi:MAG: CCA tRNA nucleotidyltransferase [Thermoleophilia bacterium]|nr:CCA tRNA nucleotidyltransferase [Thermoleophilia bacterium]